jgi:methionyl aminopeptidase
MITYKTSEEIAILREGGKRHSFILGELAKIVAPGVWTQDLEDLARKLIEEGGAKEKDSASFLNYTPRGVARPYPAALCVSINDEIVHGIPNENPRTLKEGDVVSVDLGLTHKNLITDSAITVGVGKLSDENKKLIEYGKEALYLGIKAARGGNHVGDIGHAIESFARERGVNLCEGLAGHGVGYKVHEDPFVENVGKPRTGELLKPGMVIAIEPMITFGSSKILAMPDGYTYKTKDGSVAVHFEHTIAITDGDPIVLTK